MKTNYQAEVKKMALQWDAEIEKVPTEDGWQIEVSAPEGKCWDNGPGTLIAHYGGTWGKIAAAWEDLYFRMVHGLTDRTDDSTSEQPSESPRPVGRPKGSFSAPRSQNVTVRIESLLVRKLDQITTNRSQWVADKIRKAKRPNAGGDAPGANEPNLK